MSLTEQEKAALGLFKKRLITVLSDPGLRVTVFGSKARGDDVPDSDIDVLVEVSSGDWHAADKVYAVATEVLLDSGVLISPKVMSGQRYREMVARNRPFALNVHRDGVLL